MIKIFLVLFFVLSTSLSFAEGGVEIDEIQEVIEESQAVSESNDLGRELKKLGHNKLDFGALLDPRVSEIIEKQFDATNISLKSLDQKRKHFKDEFKGTLVDEVLSKVPKLRDIIIDIITDKKSMLGLISILQKEKERTYLIYVLVSVFILNIILKMTLVEASSGFFVRFFQRLIINLFTFSLSMGSLYYLFSKELTPVIEIIKSHF